MNEEGDLLEGFTQMMAYLSMDFTDGLWELDICQASLWFWAVIK